VITTSGVAWSRSGVEQAAESSKAAETREVFQDILGLVPPQPTSR